MPSVAWGTIMATYWNCCSFVWQFG